VTPNELWMLVDESSYGDGEIKFQHLSSMGY